MVLLGTVGSEAGAKVAEIGVQFTLLGGIALALGALRLWVAGRTRPRMLLMAGLLLFALGLTAQSLERLGLLEMNYYPGWKADMDQVLGEDHADFEYSDEDMEVDSGVPAWWEGGAWWGQRLALLGGMLLASLGFVVEGRELLQGGGKTKPRRKRAAR